MDNVDTRQYMMRLKKILDVYVAICEKHHLRYYLSSGTLLGAVRHSGFIPWDDDIDVDMPMEDYKIFCKIAQKELGERYFFQTYNTDKVLNVPWGRIRENGTTSMPVRDAEFDIHYGVDIDIFPMVGIYNNKLLAKMQEKMFSLIVTLLQADYYKIYHHWSPSKFVKGLYALPRSLRKSFVNIFGLFVYRNFRDAENGFTLYEYSCKRNPAYYKESIKLNFEGSLYDAPAKWDAVLKEAYGDYMTLPPLDQRNGHADSMGEIIFDLNKDFKEYKREMGYIK
ncbi:MAG: LicD family protein [Lachnospiraceae bacterium]|nr:LicD family protein [Lachnospiraceae bacterium]